MAKLKKRTAGRYEIKGTASAAQLRTVQAALKKLDPDCEWSIVKIERDPSRADQLAEAAQMVRDAQGIVEDLKDQVEGWKDNLPENLQNGDNASELDECVSALDGIYSTLDEAENEMCQVSFPGMY